MASDAPLRRPRHSLKFLRNALAPLRRTPLHPQWLIPPNDALLNAIREKIPPGSRVLDIGCGDQWLHAHLPTGCHYTPVDWPTTGKAYGSQPTVHADARRLPFANASMDAVLLVEVLEHLPEPGLALAEIARVLKPNAPMVLSMPFLYPLHDEPYDFQRYTSHGLGRALNDSGFAAVKVFEQGHAVRTAGLLASLALAGSAVAGLRRPQWRMVPALLTLACVPLINIACWLTSFVTPGWTAMTNGYLVTAHRRG